MLDSKYSKFLTVLLIIVIIGIVGLLGYLGYDFYRKYYTENDAQQFTEEYETEVSNQGNNDEQVSAENPIDGIQSVETSSETSANKKYTYKGFDVSGTIEITKTNVKYPIITNVSKKAIETAVAIQYGPGPNKEGNTVIVGHNYRNGLFFSNNKKLALGDEIYITDNSGTKLKYTIYNKYETTPEDTDYMIRNTNGAKEISLSTCTDDSSARLIIWAKVN